jgi:Sulfotransferase family
MSGKGIHASKMTSASWIHAIASRWAWLVRSPFHRVVWFVALSIGWTLSLIRWVQRKPCGAARYDVNVVEAEARRLAGDAEASFEDRFHHDALSVVPQAMLQSDIRHFVFALPLAHILEKKLRVERAVRLGRVAKNRPPAVFIIGLPRTGSTLLHQLCGMDSRMRPIRVWEYKMPLVLSSAPADKQERIVQMQKRLDFFYRIAPSIRAVHFISATDPDECVQGFVDCALPEWYLWGAIDAPDAFDWYVNGDMTAQYQNLERLIQVALFDDEEGDVANDKPQRDRSCHLILESPHHTSKLPEIASVFPEAKFVWLHRDPVKSVGSCCSMNEAILDVTCARYVDPHVLGARTMERLALCLEKGARDREELERQGRMFVDVQYDDLMRDPLAALKAMYTKLGLDANFPAEFVRDVVDHTQNEKRQMWKEHRYSLDHFGLNEDAVRRRFAAYSARFLQ